MTDIPASKVCTKCGEDKPLDEYHKCKKSKFGRVAKCKACAKLNYLENREKKIKQVAEYRAANKDKVEKVKSDWYKKNKEKVQKYQRGKYLSQREMRIEKQKLAYQRDPEAGKKRASQWYKDNRDRVRSRIRRRYREDVEFRMSGRIKESLHRVLRLAKVGKCGRTLEVVGYTPASLMARMEVQFQPGMSWDNYGEWHIDHKIPVSWFLNKGETRPHIINALSNLQPLWAEENMSKGARWVG